MIGLLLLGVRIDGMKKNIFLFGVGIFVCALLLYGNIAINPVSLATDSGFDTSYDSGGGSSSGFDSGSSSGGGGGELIIPSFEVLVVINAVMFILTGYWIYKSIKNKQPNDILPILIVMIMADVFTCLLFYQILVLGVMFSIVVAIAKVQEKHEKKKKQKDKEKYEKSLTDEDRKLLELGYNIFVEVQMAWMNFDYEKLRTLVTDDLYNMYSNQLHTLELKGQKNMMHDFVLENRKILSKKLDGDTTVLITEMEIHFYDYIVNENYQVVRGTKNRKVEMTYKLTFVYNEQAKDVCPHCGAQLNGKNICEYCHSTIQSVGNNMKLTKKEATHQK